MALAEPVTETQTMTDPTLRRFRGSAKIAEYDVMNEKLGEGTFGVVSKARSKRTGQVVALKKILMHNEKEGFPITALREVKLLKMLSHPNILKLEEMAVERQPVDEKGKTGKKRATLYMVTPYMDHDLSGMLTNPDIMFSVPQIKCYMLQLLEGVRYLHNSNILHRDMKAANILISNRGVLQIADFGLARHYDGLPPQAGRGSGEATRDYTSLVVTRWYRPPELLLTLKRYTPAIDMWGVGCVFGEMFELKPILEGKTDVDQCVRIFKLVGSPNDSNMPGWSDLPGCEGTKTWNATKGDIDRRFGPKMGSDGLDLLKQLLCLDWRKRINAIDALQHDYFKTAPLPARPEDLPRYKDSHELDARRRGHEKPPNLPPAPAGGTVGMGPDEYGNGYGYGDRRGYRDNRGHGGGGGGGGRPYDDRRGGPPPNMDRGRQPAWKQDRDGHAPRTNGHVLPARPPSRDRAPQGQAAGAGRGDVYIPSYDGRQRDRDYERRDDRGGRREGNPRENERGGERGVDRDRGAYRDADALSYRDRGRDGGGDQRDQRRTRSRSPARNDTTARRERLQDRERDFYRL